MCGINLAKVKILKAQSIISSILNMLRLNGIYRFAGHVPVSRGVASDPLTGSGAYVSGSGGVETSRRTGT